MASPKWASESPPVPPWPSGPPPCGPRLPGISRSYLGWRGRLVGLAHRGAEPSIMGYSRPSRNRRSNAASDRNRRHLLQSAERRSSARVVQEAPRDRRPGLGRRDVSLARRTEAGAEWRPRLEHLQGLEYVLRAQRRALHDQLSSAGSDGGAERASRRGLHGG